MKGWVLTMIGFFLSASVTGTGTVRNPHYLRVTPQDLLLNPEKYDGKKIFMRCPVLRERDPYPRTYVMTGYSRGRSQLVGEFRGGGANYGVLTPRRDFPGPDGRLYSVETYDTVEVYGTFHRGAIEYVGDISPPQPVQNIETDAYFVLPLETGTGDLETLKKEWEGRMRDPTKFAEKYRGEAWEQNGEIYQYLFQVTQERQYAEKAREQYEQVRAWAKERRDSPPAHIRNAPPYEVRSYESTIVVVERPALWNLAWLRQTGLNDYKAAVDLYQAIEKSIAGLQRDPLHGHVQFQLAQCYEHLNDKKNALAKYREYQQKFPDGFWIEHVKERLKDLAEKPSRQQSKSPKSRKRK